jgi:hypothetical protein
VIKFASDLQQVCGFLRVLIEKGQTRQWQKKSTNNDLQNITHKTKDQVTQTPLKTGVNSGAPEG